MTTERFFFLMNLVQKISLMIEKLYRSVSEKVDFHVDFPSPNTLFTARVRRRKLLMSIFLTRAAYNTKQLFCSNE